MLDLANILFTIIWSITVPDNCQSCPTYEELDLIYPDNTHPGVSGHIIDNSRTPPNMENQWKYYEQQGYDYLIFYDPPPEIVNRSLHITIQPSVPTYKLNQGLSTSLNMTENKVIFASDRWVGNNCGSASISAKVWVSLLGDTMGYMKSGCDSSHTVFNHNATYVYSSNEEETKSFEWGLASEGQKTTNANTGGKLTKQNNIFTWQLDLQKYIEKWIDSILHPYELDLSDQEWDRELEKIKEDN